MEARFVPLNAAVALYSLTVTSWPRPFYDAGYRLEALECPIAVGDGDRVVPDAIGFSRRSNRFVPHEAKSGANVEPDQAQRYLAIEPATLVRTVSVTVESAEPLRSQTNYLCLREAEARILHGLEAVGVIFPVLSVGDSDLRAVGAPFEDSALAEAFAEPIGLPGPPPGVITLDADSPDEAFDEVVFPSLVAAASRGLETVSIAALAEDAISHFAIYPLAYKRRLRRAVAEAARRAAVADPQRWEVRGRTESDDDGLVRILSSPEEADPRGRTQQYQAIRSRLETGRKRPRPPEAPGQGVLFGEKDLEGGAELEKELDRATVMETEDGEEGL